MLTGLIIDVFVILFDKGFIKGDGQEVRAHSWSIPCSEWIPSGSWTNTLWFFLSRRTVADSLSKSLDLQSLNTKYVKCWGRNPNDFENAECIARGMIGEHKQVPNKRNKAEKRNQQDLDERREKRKIVFYSAISVSALFSGFVFHQMRSKKAESLRLLVVFRIYQSRYFW